MKNMIVILLVLSICGNIIGAYFVYKALKLRNEVKQLQRYHADLRTKYDALKDDFAGISVYSEDNSRLLRESTPEERKKMTVLFGASITKGFDAEKYFPGKGIINRGVGSQSDMQLLGRFSSDVLELQSGRVVIKFCSGNFKPASDLEMMWNEYEMMAQEAAQRDIQPLLATVLPATKSAEEFPNYSISAQVAEFNRRLKEFAAAQKMTVIDYYAALADKDGFLPDSLARDPIHPNDKGYDVMARVLEPILK